MDLAHAAVVVAFAAVFVIAMRRSWELTAIFFGVALLIHGCEIMAAKERALKTIEMSKSHKT